MLILFFFEETVVVLESSEELVFLPTIHSLVSITLVNGVPEIAPVLVGGQGREEVRIDVHDSRSKDVGGD